MDVVNAMSVIACMVAKPWSRLIEKCWIAPTPWDILRLWIEGVNSTKTSEVKAEYCRFCALLLSWWWWWTWKTSSRPNGSVVGGKPSRGTQTRGSGTTWTTRRSRRESAWLTRLPLHWVILQLHSFCRSTFCLFKRVFFWQSNSSWCCIFSQIFIFCILRSVYGNVGRVPHLGCTFCLPMVLPGLSASHIIPHDHFKIEEEEKTL